MDYEDLKELYFIKESQMNLIASIPAYARGTTQFEHGKRIYTRLNNLYRKLGGCEGLAKERGWCNASKK